MAHMSAGKALSREGVCFLFGAPSAMLACSFSTVISQCGLMVSGSFLAGTVALHVPCFIISIRMMIMIIV